MQTLCTQCENSGINLTKTQADMFKQYMDYLLEFNSHTNLTAITESDEVQIKHFFDSIILSKFLKIEPDFKVIDVGTGAGFPGVPLKILLPDIKLTLVDSLNKRVKFLNELCEKLNLTAEIFHARAEELSHKSDFREKFDIAVSRAVARLNVLSEYCLPYVKVGGFFAALKGDNAAEEINSARDAIKKLGGKIESVQTFELPLNMGNRTIVIIKKIKETDKKFPRSNSQISKNPM